MNFFYLFILIFSPLVCFGEANFFYVYYTLKNDPKTSFVLNCITPKNDTLFVQVKNQEQIVASKISKGKIFTLPTENRYVHHLSFTQLSPNTIYDVEISDVDGVVNRSKIQTISNNLQEVKVAIGGDLEIITEARPILTQIASVDPSLIFFGGDYPKDVVSLYDYKKWDEWFEITTEILIKKNGCMIPWVVAIGNNEVFGSFNQPIENAPFYHAYFSQNEEDTHYFSLPITDQFYLIVLDSGLTATHDGVQKKWLEQVLAENNHYPIKMALYHVPIYPSVRFKEKTWSYRLAESISKLGKKKHLGNLLLSTQSKEGYTHWAPLFDQYKVLCAFEHHDHAFKRTGPIKMGKINHQGGTYYLGDGALAPFAQFTPIQKFFDFRLKKTIGHVQFFWLMNFHESNILFQAISSYGKSIDQFSIKASYE